MPVSPQSLSKKHGKNGKEDARYLMPKSADGVREGPPEPTDKASAAAYNIARDGARGRRKRHGAWDRRPLDKRALAGWTRVEGLLVRRSLFRHARRRLGVGIFCPRSLSGILRLIAQNPGGHARAPPQLSA